VTGSGATATAFAAAVLAAGVSAGVDDDAIRDLRERHLVVPVQGVDRDALHDTFGDRRDATRRHEALDIPAPRDTPVIAVDDGTVAKLFRSKPGGITIYHYDPSRTYAYYYAHLARYAEGLKAGDTLRRGEIIGYVGTTGNEPPATPHLHFAIFKLAAAARWWEGVAIDPYPVLK
jgi:murein DD-endopeptidase MepM/ murein hydrolase activator NlpD